MRTKTLAAFGLLFGLLTVSVTPQASAGAAKSGADAYSALAYLPTGLGPAMIGVGATADVTITIERYTSDQEAQELHELLLDGGPGALSKALEKMKPIGRIAVGYYDFKVIRSMPSANGRTIIAVADRPIEFLEVYFRTRSTEYTFGVVELYLDAGGKREKGHGEMIYAAKIKRLDGQRVEIEDYGIQPIRLMHLRKL
jgi:hypothetical protein